MATLSVLHFADPSLAEAALPRLGEARRSGSMIFDDAALLSWHPECYRPAIRRLEGLDPARPLAAAFWQLFFGSTFLLPLAVEALGNEALDTGSLAALGIDDRFVRELRRTLVRDTSGLLLLTRDATPDRVLKALGQLDFTLLSASLTDRQWGALFTAFGSEEGRRSLSRPSTVRTR